MSTPELTLETIKDAPCPTHGPFIGTNCTYCDYPPLGPGNASEILISLGEIYDQVLKHNGVGLSSTDIKAVLEAAKQQGVQIDVRD